MKFDYRNPELERALAAANTFGELDAAMVELGRLMPELMSPENRGRKLYCPGFDALVPGVAAKLKLADRDLPKSNDNCCIVATGFYATGGHSRVASDISRLIGGDRMSFVFTDLYSRRNYKQFVVGAPNPLFAYRSALILSAPSVVEKTVELYMMLAAIRPSRIFLMGNHMDIVAVAACWPFRSIVDYVHHADHAPSLGATLPFSAHADLTHACHEACKARGLDPVWASMTLDRNALRASRSRREGPLRIATCGPQHKYEQPAAYRWTDFAAAALKDSDAEFLHIGEVDDAGQQRIRSELSAAGVVPERYRFLGTVRNLAQTLIDERAGAYLASYPEGGARANFEAIAAGLAPVVPLPAELPELLYFSSPLPTWVAVGSPGEVPAALTRSLELSDRIWDPEIQAALASQFEVFERYVLGQGQPSKASLQSA